jgi:hypothetical protein
MNFPNQTTDFPFLSLCLCEASLWDDIADTKRLEFVVFAVFAVFKAKDWRLKTGD